MNRILFRHKISYSKDLKCYHSYIIKLKIYGFRSWPYSFLVHIPVTFTRIVDIF